MTKLFLHNTLSRTKELFTPIDANRITMYVCGPTTYNYVHIGNARPVIVFDLLFRLLKNIYPNVSYARNITDIDDKIINTAEETGEAWDALGKRYAQAFFEDMAQLNNLVPSVIPYATDHIEDMIQMIQTLIEKGHAYEADGHVLFAVQTMKDYGKLSGRSLEDMLAGARVEVASYKKYAGDFVLWKPSAAEQPGWDSPWGRGRPGWHIECSAMINKHLGREIDIHGGGADLMFPHHENEIAQGCCAHDSSYVKYWMHNGYINIDGEKMSKSLGNFRLVRDLLDQFNGETLRFALISAHYRSPLNWTEELLIQAKTTLDGFYTALRRCEHINVDEITVDLSCEPAYLALCDDLNTPVALRELHAISNELNKTTDEAAQKHLKSRILAIGKLLGILQESSSEWFQSDSHNGPSASDIEALIQERLDARKNKDYARSDEIRDQLKEQGVLLEDSREGTQWTRS